VALRAIVEIDAGAYGLARVGGRRRLRVAVGRHPQIGHDGADVVVGEMREAVAHHVAHRSEHDALAGRHAGLEEPEHLVVGPAADALAHVVGNIRRQPAADVGAREGVLALHGAEPVARRVALAAMAEALDQIGAAVDLRGPVRVGRKRAGAEEQLAPECERGADVEWKAQRVGLARRVDRREREQVGLDRERVVAGDLGERREWERRIEILAAAAEAVMHGAVEFVVAPIADAGRRVGRDVGAGDAAERRIDQEPPA
jgi:hypothetical protein